MDFSINQVVKGAKAGTFVILGFRTIGGERHAQLKPVNPDNFAEHGAGELALPLDAIKPLDRICKANTTHLYSIGYGAERHVGTINVEANTRTQACRMAERAGYPARDCNMVG